jgi:CxxC-x17-CxxC domain-containing protein
MYQDKTLVCKECGSNFTFSSSEQEFFASKGFTNEPGRCPLCRAAKKAQNNGRSSRGQNFQNGREERQMYSTVCHACGAQTQVPFKPNGDKPVYCRDCYQSRRQY